MISIDSVVRVHLLTSLLSLMIPTWLLILCATTISLSHIPARILALTRLAAHSLLTFARPVLVQTSAPRTPETTSSVPVFLMDLKVGY
jgi:hypothetical protein